MKILIVLAFMVVFISVFFILFTSNALGESYLECEGPAQERVCVVKELDAGFTFGVSFILFFILLSFFTMYITFKSLKEEIDA